MLIQLSGGVYRGQIVALPRQELFIEPQVPGAENERHGHEPRGISPEHHRWHGATQAYEPTVRRHHAVSPGYGYRIAIACRNPVEASVNRLVQVQAVRLSRRNALQDLSAIDRKEGFEYRIRKKQKREPRRDLRVSHHKQDGKFRQPKAKQISAAVAEEDSPLGIIPD